jgi:peroxiredoxin
MRAAQVLQFGFVVLAGLAMYSFVNAMRDGERRRSCTPICVLRPEYAGFDRRAPDFELPTTDGGKFRLSDHRGQVVILNFWTKTCRPCLEEMPTLAEFGEILTGRNKNVLLVTVNTDESVADASDTLRSVLQGKQAPFITAVDSENAIVREKFGTKLYPETWYIDPEGVIRARFDGPRDWSNALYLELAEGLLKGGLCPAALDDGKLNGDTASLCADLPSLSGS